MEVEWEIDDGYVSKDRPQTTEIDDDELAFYETDEEKEDLINECIQDDFDSRISWYRV